MKRFFLLIILSFSVFLCSAQKTQKQQLRDAERTAVSWLAKLNKKQYQDCWNMLSEQTQTQTTFKQWNAYFSTELMPELGDFISRKYYLAEIEKDIDGLPGGLYVTVRYNSDYANTENVEEIVFLGLNKNDNWSIFSYFTEYQLKDDNGEFPKSQLKN
ncbi:MAG: DUF4019 domain-containing protein [Bacteroidota bacterium]|nr:DUF4019 domain-containing protein [Bacteroidota bacterium]